MTRTCAHCASEFQVSEYPGGKPRPQRFCCGRCRRAAHEYAARKTCVDCGARLGPGSGYPRAIVARCWECHRKLVHEPVAARDRDLEQMWAAGKSMCEISAALGWSKGHLSVELDRARGRGAHLPYRHRAITRAHKFPGLEGADPG